MAGFSPKGFSFNLTKFNFLKVELPPKSDFPKLIFHILEVGLRKIEIQKIKTQCYEVQLPLACASLLRLFACAHSHFARL